MVDIIIVSDGHGHFKTAAEEYIKRLQGDARVTAVKSTKGKDPNDIKRRESEALKTVLESKKAYTVYCDVTGKPISTEGLLDLVEKRQLQSEKVRFVVGGAYGIDEAAAGKCMDERISFSACTLPHGLALLVLLEQLYRIFSIRKGGKYHHG